MALFIGRKRELRLLNGLLEKPSASLVVVKGRRRIGKSYLIEEFGKQFDAFYSFIGLAPEKEVTAELQLEEFCRQMAQQFNIPYARYDNWSDVFWALSERVKTGKILLLFDEISWMGSHDPAFLGKIKNLWDLHLKKNENLVFVMCGSVSTWIEKNIISSTGFVGRISLQLTVQELPLADCSKFWLDQCDNVSSYEKFKMLSVTGGVPRYLEEINPRRSAEDNIKRMGFDKSGLLFNEFNQIFSDLFASRSALYKNIVLSILNGSSSYEEIYKKLDRDKAGVVGDYLNDLVESGFIQRDFTWHLSTGKVSKLSKFRISDNYIRFYLKYIDPQKDKIVRGAFENMSLSLLAGWDTIMGLQFENLVLSNRKKIHQLLDIKPEDIVQDNPFFQNKTVRQAGCQIDYLIQTRFNSLYVCEIKFYKNPVTYEVANQVKKKIERLSRPRHMSCRPVLIHVNGVTDQVRESDYFAHIIDFNDLLQEGDNSYHV